MPKTFESENLEGFGLLEFFPKVVMIRSSQ